MVVKRSQEKLQTAEPRAAEGMGGLAKGLAVIEALSTQGVLSAADAARAANATRAAARRCLLTLVELGYVERVGREFRPLPRLRNLGRARSLRERLIEDSAAILAEGRDALNESVSLAVLDEGRSLFVARAEAEHIISTGVRVGATLPVHCSASGRVLLSGLDDQEIAVALGKKVFAPRTPKALTKPAQVAREIRFAREAGYAISDEEIEIGMRALAVPVRDLDDKIVAAVSVSALSARVSLADLSGPFLEVLRRCAVQIEERCFGKRHG